MFARLPQHRGGSRRQIGVAVDLTVRMGQRHPDFLAAVLETEHLLDARCGHQVGGAVPPCVDDEPGMRRFEPRERTGVVAGEADHLAAAVTRRGHEAGTGAAHRRRYRICGTGQAREPILENDDVVVGRGHLAGQAGRTWTQRALVGRRLVGAVLAQRGDDHPLPRRPVEPQLRLVRGTRRQRPAIFDRRRTVPGQREEQQVTAVGQLRPRRRCHDVED